MTRDDIEAIATSLKKPVPFDGGGLSMFLRPLVAGEQREAAAWQKVHGEDLGYQFLFVRSVCDADGKRLYADADATIIATYPVPIVEAVITRVMELNRMGSHEKKVPSTGTPN